jgi:hypothetical protein
MRALYHGRCIQKLYQTTRQLKYIFIYIYNWVWPRGITVIIYLKTLIMIYYFSPLTKKLVEFLVNLTTEVVQLLQPILIFFEAKGKGGTRGE